MLPCPTFSPPLVVFYDFDKYPYVWECKSIAFLKSSWSHFCRSYSIHFFLYFCFFPPVARYPSLRWKAREGMSSKAQSCVQWPILSVPFCLLSLCWMHPPLYQCIVNCKPLKGSRISVIREPRGKHYKQVKIIVRGSGNLLGSSRKASGTRSSLDCSRKDE